MIKIIAEKNHWNNKNHYQVIFSSTTQEDKDQLSLLIDLWNDRIFSDIKQGQDVEEYNGILIKYNLFNLKNYYVIFYNSQLWDDYWENVCEQKYGVKEFVWDEDVPMLKFSEKNFKEILNFWQQYANNDFQYLIITQDDFGWIDIQGKQELDEKEKILIQSYQSIK